MEKIHFRKSTSLKIFNRHLSELILEVEGIKLKALRNDIDGIEEHIERMNALLLEITDARMNIPEKYGKFMNLSLNNS